MYESNGFAGWLWKRKGFVCDQRGGIPSGKTESAGQVPVHTENVADRRCDCADATFGRLCCGICAAFTGYENW